MRKEEGTEKKEKKEDGGGSLLAQAAQAQKEAKAQADRERALARQKELAGGPRTSDIAHMAVSSPVQLRASTSERTASPSVFGDKVSLPRALPHHTCYRDMHTHPPLAIFG